MTPEQQVLERFDLLEQKVFDRISRLESIFGIMPDQFVVTQAQIDATVSRIAKASAALQKHRAIIRNFNP